jgi:hypothetical protein
MMVQNYSHPGETPTFKVVVWNFENCERVNIEVDVPVGTSLVSNLTSVKTDKSLLFLAQKQDGQVHLCRVRIGPAAA